MEQNCINVTDDRAVKCKNCGKFTVKKLDNLLIHTVECKKKKKKK